MKNYIVRKDIPKTYILYTLMIFVVIFTVFFISFNQWEYYQQKSFLSKEIYKKNKEEASLLFDKMIENYGFKKAIFEEYLYFLAIDINKDTPKQEIIHLINLANIYNNSYFFENKKIFDILGKAYYLIGEYFYMTSIKYLEKNLETLLKNDDINDLSKMYELYLKTDNIKKGEKIIVRLLELDNNNKSYEIEYVKILLSTGKDDEALKILKKILFSENFDDNSIISMKLINQILEKRKLFKEQDFILEYTVEKSNYQLEILKEYLDFKSKRENQKSLISYIYNLKKNNNIDSTGLKDLLNYL